MAHDLYTNAFVVQSIRQVALSQTAGHSALIRTLSIAELLADADAARQEAVAEARSSERSAVLSELGQAAEARLETRATELGGRIATGVMAALLVGADLLAARDMGLFGGQIEPRSVTSWLLLALAAYGALDLFGFVSAASLKHLLTRGISRAILRLQRILT